MADGSLYKATDDPEGDGLYLRDDLAIKDAGGVQPGDRIEVRPWIAKEGRFSWASNDPKASELAMFNKEAK